MVSTTIGKRKKYVSCEDQEMIGNMYFGTRAQAYFVLLCFALLYFADVAFFTN